jgi:RNA polymerase sigma-70 factor (ECF subfamily)
MASEYPVELPLLRSERDSEAALVARAAAGDGDAYAALVRPHEHVAFRVAVSITGWNADAQEAVQNAYVKAYRSLRRFRRGAPFRPWLLRIVVNEARNVRRAELRHERLAERAAERLDPDVADTDETVLAREEAAVVLDALARLSEEDRLVIALRYFAGLPDADAAALAGASTGAYRVRLVRARRRLEALLENADV